MKKGFTLIELLAVIVILAIIALIITPVVSDIIKNTKKQAVKQSALHLIEAGENYVAKKLLDANGNSITYPIAFTCDGVNCSNETETLEVSGDIPKSGMVVIESEKNIYVTNMKSYDDKCLFGTKTSLVEGDCIDTTLKTKYGIFNGDTLVVSWYDLVNTYGLDITKDCAFTGGDGCGRTILINNNFSGYLKIPPVVTKIGASQFRDSGKLTGVHFPSSVKSIGAEAFNKHDVSVFTEAVFEEPDGWYLTHNEVEESITDLSNKSKAASRLAKRAGGSYTQVERWYKK